jgi:hypothetical protein
MMNSTATGIAGLLLTLSGITPVSHAAGQSGLVKAAQNPIANLKGTNKQ